MKLIRFNLVSVCVKRGPEREDWRNQKDEKDVKLGHGLLRVEKR